MLAYESAVLGFKGSDIFNEEFMIKMLSKFFIPGDTLFFQENNLLLNKAIK